MDSHSRSSYSFPTLPSPTWVFGLKNQTLLGHCGLAPAWNPAPGLPVIILSFELQALNFPIREPGPLGSSLSNGPLGLGQSVIGSLSLSLQKVFVTAHSMLGLGSSFPIFSPSPDLWLPFS